MSKTSRKIEDITDEDKEKMIKGVIVIIDELDFQATWRFDGGHAEFARRGYKLALKDLKNNLKLL